MDDYEAIIKTVGTTGIVWVVFQLALKWIVARKWNISITPKSLHELTAERDQLKRRVEELESRLEKEQK